MDAEGIERIVIAEFALEIGAGEEGNDARQDANDDGTAYIDETAGRSNDDQARYRTRTESENARLALKNPFRYGPCERGNSGCHRGCHERIGSHSISSHSAA